MEPELLSIGRESVIWREGDIVSKSYAPEQHPHFAEHYRRMFGDVPGLQQHSPTKQLRESYFRREYKLLEALSGINPRRVPRFIQAYQDSLTIKTEYFPGRTFAEAISAKEVNALDATETMIRMLASFHSTCNHNIESLMNAANLKRRVLRKEVNDRMRRHRAIVYSVSSDFEDYCTVHGLDSQNSEGAEIKESLDAFINQRVNFKIRDIVARNREISRERRSFVWAEANPKNLFYPPEGASEDWVMAIDFPRAYLGGISDLANIIDNVYRLNPTRSEEEYSFYLATEYFGLIGAPKEQIPDLYAYTLAFRGDELIRSLANYCQKTTFEIKKLFGQEKTANGGNGSVKEGFLNQFLEYISFFFDYYYPGSGEGWTMLKKSNPTLQAQRVVKDQLRSMEAILTDTGVKRGKILSQRRAERIRNLLNPDN